MIIKPAFQVILKNHARAMESFRGAVRKGIYCDCQGTLFPTFDMPPQENLKTLLLTVAARRENEAHIISSTIDSYGRALKAHGLYPACAIMDKDDLADELRRTGQVLEFMIDDQPHRGLPAVTSLHPRQLVHAL